MENNNKDTPRWKSNSESLLVVYSILAAIVGIFLIYVLSDNAHYPEYYGIIVIPFILSMFLFIYSGEQITDALDEEDLDKLVFLYVPYNIAVILLFWGIASTIYVRYFYTLDGKVLPLDKQILPLTTTLILLVIFSFRWLKNLYELFFWSEKQFDDYKKQLEGGKVITNHGFLMRQFYNLRRRFAKKE